MKAPWVNLLLLGLLLAQTITGYFGFTNGRQSSAWILALHGILAYARNLPPAKPIEVGDLDAMRATARIHLQNFLS